VDDEGKPTGIADTKNRAAGLNEFLMRRINPRPLLSVAVHLVRGHEIIAVEIPVGSEKPYSLNREIWVRLGSSTMRADRDQSSRLVERSTAILDRWEREPLPGFVLEDCDSKELRQAQAEIAKAGRFGIDVPDADEVPSSLSVLPSLFQHSKNGPGYFCALPKQNDLKGCRWETATTPIQNPFNIRINLVASGSRVSIGTDDRQ